MVKINENITSLNISVPSEIFLALRESEIQFISNMKKYTALIFFQNRKLSVGQCAELANMTEENFIYFLSENKVSLFDYHDESTLRKELTNA